MKLRRFSPNWAFLSTITLANITKATGVPCRRPFARKDIVQDAILQGEQMTRSKIK
jgi:hypothetical protein